MLTRRQQVAYYFVRKRRRSRVQFPGGVIQVNGFTMQVTLTVE